MREAIDGVLRRSRSVPVKHVYPAGILRRRLSHGARIAQGLKI